MSSEALPRCRRCRSRCSENTRRRNAPYSRVSRVTRKRSDNREHRQSLRDNRSMIGARAIARIVSGRRERRLFARTAEKERKLEQLPRELFEWLEYFPRYFPGEQVRNCFAGYSLLTGRQWERDILRRDGRGCLGNFKLISNARRNNTDNIDANHYDNYFPPRKIPLSLSLSLSFSLKHRESSLGSSVKETRNSRRHGDKFP